MRFVVCLIVGALVGAILATSAASLMRPKQSYPRSLMVVIKEEMKLARAVSQDKNCEGLNQSITKLGLLGHDIERIPHGDPPDRVFRQYSEDFRNKLQGVAAATGNCEAQRAALVDVSNACESCHRDYR
jgi:gas vesicle protein